jgi:hypothetical protein
MNSSFGPRSNFSAWDMHPGLDLPAPLGTSIYNSRGGTVYQAGPAGTDGYSNRHVSIQVSDPVDGTLYLIYMHLDTIDPGVVIGSPLAQNALIGTVGMDGATYTHCHFEIRRGCPTHDNAVHPLRYLPYTDSANFSPPVADRFNLKAGGMAARLLFDAPDKNQGDLARVEVDLLQGAALLGQRIVDFDDRSSIPIPLPGSTTGDQYLYTNDIGVEGYQRSDMVLDGFSDLKEGVLVRNLPAACDGLRARVIDRAGNLSNGALVPVPAQTAASQLLDFEDGNPTPAGWTAVTSASGTGTSVQADPAAAYAGSQGLLCIDSSSTEGSSQRAGIEFSLPAGRFEWLAEAWIDPVSLGLGPGQSVYPLAFMNGANVSVAARMRNTGGVVWAGIAAKNPDGSNTGADSGVTVTPGVWHQWTLVLLRLGTRETTAVLYLDGAEAERFSWDSSAYEPLALRAGIAFSSATATAQLDADLIRLSEDPDSMLGIVGTPAPTPCYDPAPLPTTTFTASPSPTLSATPSLSPTPSESPTETAGPPASPSPSPSATPTLSPISTASPTATASPFQGASGSASGTPAISQVLAAPNPWSRASATLFVELTAAADSLVLDFYSPGYTLIARKELAGPLAAGWVPVPMDVSQWPGGLLYVRAKARFKDSDGTALGKIYLAP